MDEPQESSALQLCDRRGKRYNPPTPLFDESQEELEDEKQEELEHYDEMGVPRGRLAVTMDLVTDAMALVGQQASIVRARVAPLGGEHPDHHGKFD